MKVAYIDPVGEEAALEELLTPTVKYWGDQTIVDYFTLKEGGNNLESHLDEIKAIPHIIELAKELKEEKYDGVIVGCFYDPGLKILKEEVAIKATGPFEATTHIAKMYGQKLGIIVGHESHKERIVEMIVLSGYKKENFLMTSLDMTVEEMLRDDGKTHLEMVSAGKRLMDKGADVLIAGCTIESGKHEILQRTLHIKVIDPIVACIKYLEELSELEDKCSW